LPPLVLQALHNGSAEHLRDWLAISPRNAATVLDTHDGIGVIDVGSQRGKDGLLGPCEIDELVESIHTASGGQSRLATGGAASNLDLYQINCSYYSALGCDDDRYLMARLVQFLSPGVPQVYYAGLLAAPNDMDLLAETGNGRDINRPHYSLADIELALRRPVVQRLMAMMRLRNTHPAFDGEFAVGGGGPKLTVSWRTDAAFIGASLDLADASFTLEHSDGNAPIDDWDGFEEWAGSQ